MPPLPVEISDGVGDSGVADDSPERADSSRRAARVQSRRCILKHSTTQTFLQCACVTQTDGWAVEGEMWVHVRTSKAEKRKKKKEKKSNQHAGA
jgi:hypothetical protein